MLTWVWEQVRAWREGEGDFRPCSTPWREDEVVGCAEGSVPVGPRNTASNAAYAAAGAVVGLMGGTAAAWTVAAAFGLLAVGSAAYHAVPGRWTNRLDHAGMYAAFLALVAYSTGASWAMVAVTAALGAAGFTYLWRANLNAMMGLLLWICMLAAGGAGETVPMVLSLATFVGAMVFWQMDRRRTGAGLWGHAAWHVLTATAMALMFIGVHGAR